jgi:hypothetical protein
MNGPHKGGSFMTEGVIMTKRELDRVQVFSLVKERKLSQVAAARRINLSLRQTQRLYKIYQHQGPIALAHKHRGKPSNHRLDKFQKALVIELLEIELYSGFGPTYMTEILERNHQLIISRETVRKLMIQLNLWKSKAKKRPVVHQQRQRRARSGELVQTDGSPHAWFEERGDKCTLIVFIDDATGRTYGKFFPVETTRAYLEVTYEYVKKYGKPQAMYSDRHNIFKINKPGCIRKENSTQFGQALKELNIQLYWANSPQAKGRVERANKTLQDRLVKELRLAGIQDIEKANDFLRDEFWDSYNLRFQKKAMDQKDMHRESPSDSELKLALSERCIRKISKNLEFQLESGIYQIENTNINRSLIRSEVTIIKQLDGTMVVMSKGKKLNITRYGEQIAGGKDVDSKQINFVEPTKSRYRHKPAKHHPWNQEKRALLNKKHYAQL